MWRRAAELVTSPATWKAIALLVLKLPIATLTLVVGLVPLGLTVALLAFGVDGLVGRNPDRFVGPWNLDATTGVALLLLAVPAGIVAIAVLDALRSVLRMIARTLLSSRSPAGGAVREALAESLGDRTLSIAYWLPDRGVFVDELGGRVDLPDVGSGRAWTAVEHEGRRVAAIVHDAELDASPELVHAAAAAAVLALENEQLKADLRARVEELRASRIRIVDAGDAARRKLERDLHDGAQQQLVALALDLQLIKGRVGDDPTTVALIEGSASKLSTALAELRELARGIHPAILTDRGLAAALSALASRVSLPVECDIELDERLPPSVEAAIYFVAAEAMTNAVKYGAASRVSVTVRRTGEDVRIEVADDGVGGADPAKGSGLRGLGDRLAVLDGQLRVLSPPGEGTRIVASVPVR
jgi:signal transduction histidine kinase